MGERFFLSAAPRDGRAVLTGDEARHLARVLRGKVGDAVDVFDGSGLAWPARIVAIGRDEVALEVDDPVAEPAAAVALTLAVALPKGERQKWLVEKLTELGAARLVPLVTERGVAEATPSACDRLRRGVIEASKQCGRSRLMQIDPPRSIAELLAQEPPDTRVVVAHPGAPPLVAAHAPRALGLVGPEGGFTADEIAAVEAAGGVRAGLGPHVLRVETAAIVLAVRLAADV
jgi:16S rRNA (uracil1498-N3)-methyltransferase